MILRQTAALFLDAYRELNAKRLFWFVLVISLLVVCAFAMVGIGPRGLTVLWFEFDTPMVTSKRFPPELLYKFIFSQLAIPIWLTWIATVLALVSTAGIIPDFVASGSIELSLSKPISRARLLITKFLTGLLFVTLQVVLFTAASFLVIGLRGGAWEPRLFLAVPIVVCFFSYLYCICALLGLVTRSTIASLLLTLLVWFAVFAVHSVEQVFVSQKLTAQMRIETLTRMVATLEGQVAREKAALAAPAEGEAPVTPPATPSVAPPVAPTQAALDKRLVDLADERGSLDRWNRWQGRLFAAKTVLPKTSETIELLARNLMSDQDIKRFMPEDRDVAPPGGGIFSEVPINVRELQSRIETEKRSRTVGWVIGTSLAFEAAMLAIACVIFIRKDF
jgi:ABC-type transport system involved in multi-copper enzyme maturation permease subunit